MMEASCAVAMARTMDRPRPWPSLWCPARIEALEGLEEAVDFSWRDDWSGVGHRQHGPAVLHPGRRP